MTSLDSLFMEWDHSLGLKTILSLTPDPPKPVLQTFCAKEEINNVWICVKKPKDNLPLTYTKVVQALEILVDPNQLPLYLHCLDGANVTGVVIMCLRKLQMWNSQSAMVEFLRFVQGGVVSTEEAEFCEKFNEEFAIPSSYPGWLWGGPPLTFRRHPTLMKLKLPIKKSPKEEKVELRKEMEEYKKRMQAELLGERREVPGEKLDSRYANDDDTISLTLAALALEGMDD